MNNDMYQVDFNCPETGMVNKTAFTKPLLRGTTPSLFFTFPVENTNYSIINIYFTQDNALILKKVKTDIVWDTTLKKAMITLSKDESLLFDASIDISIQIEVQTTDSKWQQSNIFTVPVVNATYNDVYVPGQSYVPDIFNIHQLTLATDLADDDEFVLYDTSTTDTLKTTTSALKAKILTPPSTDGTYVLKCTVLNNVITYSWVLEE